MKPTASTLLSLTAALMLSACGAHKGLNMYAHSTVGMNVDRSPPNLRIGLTRDEAVVTPTFAGGQKPNVAAGFNASYNPIKRFLFGVSTFFSGGQAATELTDWTNRMGGTPSAVGAGEALDPKQQYDDGTIICLNDRPKAPNFERAWFAKLIPFYNDDFPVEHLGPSGDPDDPSKSKHFVFTSDTTFGIKATWMGTDVFPNKLDVGFNRKEYAHAPFILKERMPGSEGDGCPKEARYLLRIPSYFAYVNAADVKDFAPSPGPTELDVSRFNALRFGYNQLFATGKAAENLAKDPDMQRNFRAIFLEGIKNDQGP